MQNPTMLLAPRGSCQASSTILVALIEVIMLFLSRHLRATSLMSPQVNIAVAMGQALS